MGPFGLACRKPCCPTPSFAKQQVPVANVVAIVLFSAQVMFVYEAVSHPFGLLQCDRLCNKLPAWTICYAQLFVCSDALVLKFLSLCDGRTVELMTGECKDATVKRTVNGGLLLAPPLPSTVLLCRGMNVNRSDFVAV